MRKILVLIAMVMTLNAQAIELLSVKSSGSGLSVMTEKTVSAAWASASPVCLKDGSKLLGVNKAFKAAGLKSNDCSNSEAKKRIHKIRGFEVTVLRFSELPDSMIKELSKVN